MKENCEKKVAEKVIILKALGHGTRFCIVEKLLGKKRNVTELMRELEVPQATISQHLNVLKNSGIVKGNRCGLEICYEVIDKIRDNIKKIIQQLD